MDDSGLWPWILTVTFAGAMVVAMVWDLVTFEIPDTLSVTLVVMALAALFLGGQGWSVISFHLLGGLGAFAFGVVMFSLGQWGGGDVKFMAAVSLWLNGLALIQYLLVAAIAGGVLAVAILVFRRFSLPHAWAERAWLAQLHRADKGLPYGVALGSGGLIMLGPAVAGVIGP